MLICVITGTVLGFLSGLGIGGGSLLILWLTLVMHTEQAIARNINLLFFVPSALIACLFRWKQGVLDWKRIAPALLSGMAAAGVFTWLSSYIETDLLRKPFGILLLLTGIRELLYRPRNAK